MMIGTVKALGAGRFCILVPIPGHEGRANYTRELCEEIGLLTGMRTADVLRGKHHLPLYQAKRNDMKAEGIRIDFRLICPIPKGVTPIIVDNVLDTGHTAWAAIKALGDPDTRLAVLGNTRHYTLNKEVNFAQMNIENMKNQKFNPEEVKQVKTAQSKSRTASGKKTATQNKSTAKASAKRKAKNDSLAAQYAELKEKHPDSILLFRQGDSYKAVNADASTVGNLLNLPFTRPEDKRGGDLLATFPCQALDTYLPKLVREGMRVAIVEEAGKQLKSSDEGHKKGTEENTEDKGKKESRAPQLVTLNGQKVTHAHAFQSTKNPGTWYFTARLDGRQLHPIMMKPADAKAYQNRDYTIDRFMRTYYPTKMEKKVTPEQYKADMILSDGRHIEKMNVFKERNENREDFGKYKLFAKIAGQENGMAVVMKTEDLNAFFDRVTTPAKLVEKNFGERLNLASAYGKYKLPEGIPIDDIRITKDKDGEWKISAKIGDTGRTEKVPLNKSDRYSFFESHTVTREQLAAKYLSPDIQKTLSQKKEEQQAGLKI